MRPRHGPITRTAPPIEGGGAVRVRVFRPHRRRPGYRCTPWGSRTVGVPAGQGTEVGMAAGADGGVALSGAGAAAGGEGVGALSAVLAHRLRTASRVRSTTAAMGPTAMFSARVSAPGCGRVGAMPSAVRTAVAGMASCCAPATCASVTMTSAPGPGGGSPPPRPGTARPRSPMTGSATPNRARAWSCAWRKTASSCSSSRSAAGRCPWQQYRRATCWPAHEPHRPTGPG